MRIFVFLLFTFSSISLFSQNASIVIISDYEVDIELDGKIAVSTINQTGYQIIPKLNPGIHQLKLIRKDFKPYEQEIELSEYRVFVIRMKEIFSDVIISTNNEQRQNPTKKYGSLRLYSKSPRLIIRIPELKIESYKKDLYWELYQVDPGQYSIEVIDKKDTIESIFPIIKGLTTYLNYNQDSTAIEVRKPELSNQCELKEKLSNTFEYGILKDIRDGNSYHTIRYGQKEWMVENLRYLYPEGTWVYNSDFSDINIVGYLYNWKAACLACPDGWRLPTDNEWKELELQTEMSRYWTEMLGERGYKTGFMLLSESEVPEQKNYINYSGFSAILNGYKNRSGYFRDKGKVGYYWTLTEAIKNSAYYRRFNYYSGTILRDYAGKDYGFSVRCIKEH